MKPVSAVLAVVIVLILQLIVAPHMAIAGMAPNLFVILLAAIVLGRGTLVAVILGAFIGFIVDLGNASYLGLGIISYSVVSYGIARMGAVLPEHIGYRSFVVFVSSLAVDLISLAVTASLSFSGFISSLFRFSIGSALYSALIAAFVFAVLTLGSFMGAGRIGRS